MLPVLELIRLESDPRWGTFGVLKVNKAVFCVTLEPPDRLNAPHVSSIPAGQYLCRRVQSAKYGATFEIMDVPGRTLVRFHPGNRVRTAKPDRQPRSRGFKLGVKWFQTGCRITIPIVWPGYRVQP
jgi:hypothetical protein